MGRRLRFIPEGGALVEVTCRTIHSRLLLTPGTALNEIVLGLLGRGQRLYRVKICGFVFLSNHYHLLLEVADSLQLARFMGWFNSNLAREVARLTGWRDKVWARRYTHVVISDEEEAQRARLRYLLAHGAKEGLVASPKDWPGVHCIAALTDGSPLAGAWFDRTREYWARFRGEAVEPRRFVTMETVSLSPLPAWVGLDEEVRRERVRTIVQEIEAEVAAERAQTGSQPPGAEIVRSLPPETRPGRTKRSPAPLFHAFSRSRRQEMHAAYSCFVAAFREAAGRLRRGEHPPRFGVGSFPPGAPFVGIPLSAT